MPGLLCLITETELWMLERRSELSTGSSTICQAPHRSANRNITPRHCSTMPRQLFFVALLLFVALSMSTEAPAAGDSCTVAEVSVCLQRESSGQAICRKSACVTQAQPGQPLSGMLAHMHPKTPYRRHKGARSERKLA
jgi:hypothetical protein